MFPDGMLRGMFVCEGAQTELSSRDESFSKRYLKMAATDTYLSEPSFPQMKRQMSCKWSGAGQGV